MADVLDLISLSEAKRALNIDVTETLVDIELAGVVTAVSRRLDDLCGAVVTRTLTGDLYDGEGDTQIFLRRAPIGITATTTVSSVVEYQPNSGGSVTLTEETITVKPSEGYMLDPTTGILYRRRGGWDSYWWPGRRNVAVTWAPGRYPDTASVDEKFRSAAAIAVAHIWTNIGAGAGAGRFGADNGQAFGIPPWDVPKAALMLLSAELLPAGIA
ncbi:MAG TPA: hypothetical protein VFJ85_02860 [Acidimicrobiales bacterium]|nr:hypothetical protein [Acidimicrobiales bacterium]